MEDDCRGGSKHSISAWPRYDGPRTVGLTVEFSYPEFCARSSVTSSSGTDTTLGSKVALSTLLSADRPH